MRVDGQHRRLRTALLKEQEVNALSVFEALTLMIAFAVLITAILKK